jgi:hypothetical protein
MDSGCLIYSESVRDYKNKYIDVQPSLPLQRCGRSSVVEHHLAKVEIAGSSPAFIDMVELADAHDSKKSCSREGVWVRLPPSASKIGERL